MKLRLLVPGTRVYAIQRQQMEMDVAIQSVAETLDKRDGAALGIPQSHDLFGAAAQMTQYGSGKYTQDITHEPRVISHLVPQRKRHREHPLSNGHNGENMVHQMGRHVCHASSATARTPNASLA
jgi:hypothetical protein